MSMGYDQLKQSVFPPLFYLFDQFKRPEEVKWSGYSQEKGRKVWKFNKIFAKQKTLGWEPLN